MAERDIRRCSAAALERMAAGGDYVPTRPDAPEIELDEDFWRHAKVVVPARQDLGPSAGRCRRAGVVQGRSAAATSPA